MRRIFHSSKVAVPLFFTLLMGLHSYDCLGQNAFYDAKRLYRWNKLPEGDSLKNLQVLLMDTIFKKYFPVTTNWSNIQSDVILNIRNDIDNAKFKSQDPDSLLFKIIQYFDSVKTADKAKNLRKSLNNNDTLIKMDELVVQIHQIEKSDSIINALKNEIIHTQKNWRDLDSNQKMAALRKYVGFSDSITKRSFIKILEKTYEQDRLFVKDSLLNLLNLADKDSTPHIDAMFFTDLSLRDTFFLQLNTATLNNQLNIQRQKNQLLTNFYSLRPELKKKIYSPKFSAPQLENAKNIREYLKQEFETITNETKAEEISPDVKTAISDQNFPSQSEIIDALAIYVAKRFKQELAMTFAENFARYLKDNILARELFPSSFNMIANADPYSIPKLGSEWRNSVSKDLISLPENMYKSTVVRTWLKNDTALQYLHDAVLIGSYIAQKYSFTDMVRSIYLGNGINGSGETLQASATRKALLVTYIMNEELFDTSYHRYWISPEDLLKTNATEAEIMVSLIAGRYWETLSKEFNLKVIDISKVAQIKNKYVDLLALFKQFENSQVAAFASKKQGGNMKDAFWDYQRIFLDFLLKQLPQDQAFNKTRIWVKTVQDVFFVYDYISNKNYGAAINTTLGIMDSLLKQKSPSGYIRAFLNKDNVSAIEKLSLKMPADSVLQASVMGLENMARLRNAVIVSSESGKLSFSKVQQYYLANWGDTLKNVFGKAVYNGSPSIKFLDSLAKMNSLDEAETLLSAKMNDLLTQIKTIASMAKLQDIDLRDIILMNLESLAKKDKTDLETSLQRYMDLAAQSLTQKSPEIISSIHKISGFLTDAAMAKDSKELSKVMESYAQPPLSYKLTRKSLFTIDLTAFVGAWAGTEFDTKSIGGGNGLSKMFETAEFAAGLTVPIGLNFSWANKTQKMKCIQQRMNDPQKNRGYMYLDKNTKPTYLKNSSHSIFFSVIDILGPFSYRFSNDEAEGLPSDVMWSQVLAPGIHYIYGIRNSPLSLSAGVQYSPQLRSFDDGTGKTEAFSTVRMQAAITWELPLITLHRKLP